MPLLHSHHHHLGQDEARSRCPRALLARHILLVVVMVLAVRRAAATRTTEGECPAGSKTCGAAAEDDGEPVGMPGNLQFLWSTPISFFRATDRSFFSGAAGKREASITRAELRGLAAAAREEFQRFRSSPAQAKQELRKLFPSAGSTDNDLFFFAQRQQQQQAAGGVFAKRHARLWRRLQTVIRTGVRSYLQKSGVKPHLIAQAEQAEMFLWATLQSNGTSHFPHTHGSSIVSGVFYASVPEGSGALLFQDPRGQLPPFGERFTHDPSPGDLVCFPSWLTHWVAPSFTSDAEPRVSFSFNIGGAWQSTTDVNLGIPIEAMSE